MFAIAAIGFAAHALGQTFVDSTRTEICKGHRIIPPGWTGGTITSLLPNPLPSGSYIICGGGKFRATFLDMAPATGLGFDGPTLGLTRRNCVCDVLDYIASVINIPSNIGTTDPPIDIVFDISVNSSSIPYLAAGTPTFPPGVATSAPSYQTGYVYQYISTGSKPDPLTEDGTIKVKFFHNYLYYSPSFTSDCQYDFKSIILHEMTHLLGFFSLLEKNGSGNVVSMIAPGVFSHFDDLFLYKENGTGLAKVVDNALYYPSSGGINPVCTSYSSGFNYNYNLWLKNIPLSSTTARYNQPIVASWIYSQGTTFSHFETDNYDQNYKSPGYVPNYVMKSSTVQHQFANKYSLPELRMLQDLGYSINSSYTDYPSIPNTPPYTIGYVQFAPNTLPASAAMTPPAGNSNLYITTTTCNPVTVNLSTNTISNGTTSHTLGLQDDEGDPITVFDPDPSSTNNHGVYNINGCGNGGNNNNQLSLSSGANIITFTPRPNFIGRARFGFHLYDGTERGSFVVISVDVSPDACFSITPSNEMVINGDYEEGPRVRLCTTDPYNNIADGIDLTHNYFYNWSPDACQYSSTGYTDQAMKYSSDACNSFDFNYFASTICPGAAGSLIPTATTGDRMMHSDLAVEHFNMTTRPITACHTYSFDADVYLQWGISSGSNINFGLYDDPLGIDAWTPGGTFTPYHNLSFSTTSLSLGSWHHLSTTFVYTNPLPSHFLNLSSSGAPASSYYVDNISIKEISSIGGLIVSASPSSTICPGASTTLTASGGTSYSWSPSTGLSSTTGASVVATPSTTTTYVATDPTMSSCNSGAITVTVTPMPPASITVTSGSTLCAPETLTASPSGSGYTYSWSIPGGGTASTSSILTSGPGTYNLTVYSSGGACSSSTFIIVPDYCCAASLISMPGTTVISSDPILVAAGAVPAYATNLLAAIGSGSTVSTTNNLVFIGNFNVNTNITFLSCPNMYFISSPTLATTMVVSPITNLTIRRCKLRSGCNYMWTGINAATSSSSINIDVSELHDMKLGVRSTNGAIINCTNSQFIDDDYGLNFTNVPATYTGVIKSNTFITSSTGLILPSATGAKTTYGIYMKNARYLLIGDNVSIGGGNTFDNVLTGVYIENSSLASLFTSNIDIYNNLFQNITGGTTTSIWGDAKGTGIFGKGNTSVPGQTTVNVSCVTGSSTLFQNLEKGIVMSRISANVTNTTNVNEVWGHYFYNTPTCSYNISTNAYKDIYYGISLNGNTTNAKIVGNTYSSKAVNNLLYAGAILKYPIGINVSGTSPTFDPVSLVKNTLDMNALRYTGIMFKNCGSAVTASNNTINMNTPFVSSSLSLPLEGFNILNCVGPRLFQNRVLGNSNTYNTPSPFPYTSNNVGGVVMQSSIKLHLECNRVQNTPFGFVSIGNCTTAPTEIITNHFFNHSVGILVRHLGSLGTLGTAIGSPSDDNNNEFLGAYSTLGGSATKVLAVGTATLCGTYSRRIYTSNPSLPFSTSQGWSSPLCAYSVISTPGVIPMVCQNFAGDDGDDGGDDSTGDEGGEELIFTDLPLSLSIAQGEEGYPEYPEMAQYMAEARVYTSLYKDSATRAVSAVLDSFYNAKHTSTLEDIRNADEQIGAASDSVIGTDSTLYATRMAQARAAQYAIVSTQQQEINERLIGLLYLKYVDQGADSLNEDDAALIETLALECPLVGGNAVYKARSLYELYNAPESYDDIEMCNEAGAEKGGNGHGIFDEENASLANMTRPYTSMDRVQVYPNPTTGRVTIGYLLTPQAEGSIQIIDVYGQLLQEVKLPSSLDMATVDLSGYASGIYYYRFLVNGNLKNAGKVTLTK